MNRERIEKLWHNRIVEIYRYNPLGDKTINAGDVIPLDDFDRVKSIDWNDTDNLVVVPKYAIFSDYSGGTVEIANYRYFTETYPEHATVSGAYGTCGVCFKLSVLLDSEIADEILHDLERMENYLLLDENAHCEVEIECIEKAWEGWAKRDFKRCIEWEFGIELDDVDDQALWELFERGKGAANEYWENEQGESMYIDVERVCNALSVEDIESLKK